MTNSSAIHDSTSSSEQDWDSLVEILESFSEAWESAPPDPEPDLDDFLPPSVSRLRGLAIVELVKLDMDHRATNELTWQDLEFYIDRWPEIATDQLPTDLIYEEFQIRVRLGHQVKLFDYRKRFPAAYAALCRLAEETLGATTSVYKARPKLEYDVGQKVDDFDLLTRLGKGAFATVFLARQISMQRLVALKISADQGTEPQTLAQLDHPNIVRVFDQRTLPEDKSRLMYMQYVRGGTLQEALSRLREKSESSDWNGQMFLAAVQQALESRGESAPGENESQRWLLDHDWAAVVAKVGSQLAKALHYAHGLGVLHRDLKPANVMLDAYGSPKLVDFNISFCSKIDGASPAAYFGGSLAYMSPEQLEACNVMHERQPDTLDGRSDIYSLGIILYELLTGSRPMPDDVAARNWNHMLDQLLLQRRQRLDEKIWARLDGYPQMLVDILQRCLEPKAEDRFSNADTLAQHLQWTTDTGIQKQISRKPGSRKQLVSWLPVATVLFIGFLISGLAALFVRTYNLIESVHQSEALFQTFLVGINAIAFPLGIAVMVLASWRVTKAISRARARQPFESEEIASAMRKNLKMGIFVSSFCTIEWIVAGFLYPICFWASDNNLPIAGWFNFISSHFLAGLFTGAYAYYTITYFSLKYWHPILARAAMRADTTPDLKKEIVAVRYFLNFFQMVAVSIPLMSIAILVIWNDSTSKLALGILCAVGLAGLAMLYWSYGRISSCLNVAERMFGESQ